MTDRELMQQVYQYLTGESVRNKTTDKHIAELISEGLAQPEQEPVAWLSIDCIGERYLCFSKPLDNDHVQPLYTAPPQRKPLTEEEIAALLSQSAGVDLKLNGGDLLFARAIERAHGIGSEE
jgi:hypothetical protein